MSKPHRKHMLKMTMLGFLRKKKPRWDACHYPAANPPGACPPPPRRSGSSCTIAQRGSLAERPAPLSHIQLLQHSIYMTDTQVHLQAAPITPFPAPEGGGSSSPAAEDKLGGPSKLRCNRWACERSYLQQARHPLSPRQGCFPK